MYLISIKIITLFLLISCKSSLHIPEHEVNKVRYSEIRSQFISDFEKSEMKPEFEKLRKRIYSILENGGTIYDIEEFLDKERFTFFERKSRNDGIYLPYKGKQTLQEIEKVWDKNAFKNAMKNPYIFSITLNDAGSYVTWNEIDPKKDINYSVVNPPIQVTFRWKNGKIMLHKMGKVYGVP